MEAQDIFYVLEEPRPGTPEDTLAGTNALREEGFQVGDAPKCPRCGRFIGMLTWLPPFRVEIEVWGKEVGDIVKAGACDLLVSPRFRCLYEEHQLRGLTSFEPVEVLKVKRHRTSSAGLPEYFKATVSRSRTAVDQVASGFEWLDDQPRCTECLWPQASCTLKGYKSIVIESDSWTGEDIFQARGSPVNVIVSQRFRDLCVANELNNVVFLPTNSYAWHKQPKNA